MTAPVIRSDTLPHAVHDIRRALRAKRPPSHIAVDVDTGWRVATGRVTADDGEVYIGYIVAVRGPREHRHVRCYRPGPGAS